LLSGYVCGIDIRVAVRKDAMSYIYAKFNEVKNRGIWFYVDQVLLLMCIFNGIVFTIYELIKSHRG
jgi:hypothetical protein